MTFEGEIESYFTPESKDKQKKIMFKVKLHLKSAKVAEYLFFPN